MTAGDLALRIIISVNGASAITQLGLVERSVGGVGNAVALMLGAMAVMALGRFVAASVQAAGDFQQQMIHIQALAESGSQATDKAMSKMSASILALAPQFGQMPVDLAKAMFQIVSSLVPVNQQMDALRYSAMLASTGMANVTDVARILATIMKIYGMNAATAANDVTLAVTFGRMTMQQYADAIGLVVQKGRSAGFSFNELNAALDVMTTHGFPNAGQAARNLGQLFVQMDLGMDALAGRAAKMGLKFNEAKFKTMDLAQQIAYLTQVTGGNDQKLHQLIGGGIWAFQTFVTLRNGMSDYNTILGKLGGAQAGVGAALEKWQITQAGFNIQMQKFQALLQVIQITIGNVLIPLLAPLLDWVTNLAGGFLAWMNSANPLNDALSLTGKYSQIVLPILAGLGALLLSLIIPALWAMAEALLANPITWIVLGVAGLTAALVHFYQTSKPVREFIDGLWQTIQANVLPALKQFAQWVATNAVQALQSLGQWFTSTAIPALQNFANWIQTSVVPALQNLWQWIVSNVVPALQSFGNWIMTSVIPALQNAWSYLKANFVPILQDVGTTIQLVTIPALTALGAYLLISSLPALVSFWGMLTTQVIPTLMGFANLIFGPVIESLIQMGVALSTGDIPAFLELLGVIGGAFTETLIQMGIAMMAGDIPAMWALATASLSGVVPALIAASGAAWSFTVALLANPITWVILAVVGLVGAFILFYNTIKPFRDFINNLWNNGLKLLFSALQQVWAFIQEAFAPVWAQLVQIWNTELLPSLKQLWSAIQPIMPVFIAIGVIILSVVVLALGLLVGILGGVIKAIAGFIGGLAQVFAGIVQFITGAVQFVSGILQFIYDLVTLKWDKLGSDLGMIWQGILNMFGGIWNMIVGICQTVIGTILGFFEGFIQSIIGFFQHLFDKLIGHSIVPELAIGIIQFFLSIPVKVLTGIAGFIGQLLSFFVSLAKQVLGFVVKFITDLVHAFGQGPGAVMAVIQSLPSRLFQFFGGLANQAWQWGLNIIKQIAGGLLNGIGSFLANAMSAIGNFVASHLPHSPAKVGPLRDLALQGSLIPDQIAQGILRGTPKLKSSMQQMLAGGVSLTSTGGSNTFALSPSSNQLPSVNMTVQLDGKTLTQAVGVRLAKEVRIQGNVRGR